MLLSARWVSLVLPEAPYRNRLVQGGRDDAHPVPYAAYDHWIIRIANRRNNPLATPRLPRIIEIGSSMPPAAS